MKLPNEDEFDVTIHRILTRKQTNLTKCNPQIYKFLPQSSPFDYLDKHTTLFYPITLRAVRFKITEDTYETIITNLDAEKFSPMKIKELCHLRWGIETSFRANQFSFKKGGAHHSGNICKTCYV
jgi:IS4 transposase